MERIKKALEQAKANQAQAADSPRENKQSSTGSRAIDASQENLDVKYSETKQFGLDGECTSLNRLVLGDERTPASNAYKMLRTQVLHRMVANNWNAVAVTSPAPGQGKTLTAINLAISLAQEVNYTVLLVDLDLQNPCVHKRFGFEPKFGLGDYLFNDVSLSDILFNPGLERLVVLPASASVVSSSEILSSKKMKSVVEELKTRYPSRFIVFDLPPALYTDDALAFSPVVDCFLVVVDEGNTTQSDLRNTISLLPPDKIVGTVLNRSSENEIAYALP